MSRLRERAPVVVHVPVYERWIAAQGGDPSEEALPSAAVVQQVAAPEAGYVQAIGAIDIGMAALRLGAGRRTKDDAIVWNAFDGSDVVDGGPGTDSLFFQSSNSDGTGDGYDNDTIAILQNGGGFMLYRDAPHDWSDREVLLARTIANHLASVTERTQAQQALH